MHDSMSPCCAAAGRDPGDRPLPAKRSMARVALPHACTLFSRLRKTMARIQLLLVSHSIPTLAIFDPCQPVFSRRLLSAFGINPWHFICTIWRSFCRDPGGCPYVRRVLPRGRSRLCSTSVLPARVVPYPPACTTGCGTFGWTLCLSPLGSGDKGLP